MGSKRNRGAPPGGGQERVRTHLLFSSKSDHHTTKKKRRPHSKQILSETDMTRVADKLQVTHNKKDEIVQAGAGDIDPTAWIGEDTVGYGSDRSPGL